MTAALESSHTGQLPAGYVRDLVERILPSVLAAQREGADSVNETVVEHVKQTTERMIDQSRVLHDADSDGRTAVVGVAYRLAEGRADLVWHVGQL